MPGVVHSFANPGPGQARMLVIGSRPAQAMVGDRPVVRS